MRRLRIPAIGVAVFALCGAAQAMFALMPAERVRDVPVERLLANVERNAQHLTPAQQARTIGRLHLLAYLRQSDELAVYRDRPAEVAEGHIGDCAALDAQTMGKGNRNNWPKPRPGELCEARDYHLGPEREIPGEGAKPPRPNAHLTAAIAAYTRAKDLEPDNLRTRLALAFALDRSGQREAACNELRFVARRALDLIQLPAKPGEPRADWETHVVASEAAEHFDRIAISDDDRRLAAALRARLDAAPPAMYVTPIFVPLVANAELPALIERKSKVAFDFSGQGAKLQLGWLSDKAAWLVWDPRRSGKIESGFQLFGSVTWIAFWENGYLPLGALDDDGDGKISGTELDGLALWRDTNANGISDKGEVTPVPDYKIVALGYDYERSSDDMWVAKDGVSFANGETRPSYDWRLHETVLRPVGH